jgi:hypothetical protein
MAQINVAPHNGETRAVTALSGISVLQLVSEAGIGQLDTLRVGRHAGQDRPGGLDMRLRADSSRSIA